jgi:hypothetical protein
MEVLSWKLRWARVSECVGSRKAKKHDSKSQARWRMEVEVEVAVGETLTRAK